MHSTRNCDEDGVTPGQARETFWRTELRIDVEQGTSSKILAFTAREEAALEAWSNDGSLISPARHFTTYLGKSSLQITNQTGKALQELLEVKCLIVRKKLDLGTSVKPIYLQCRCRRI